MTKSLSTLLLVWLGTMSGMVSAAEPAVSDEARSPQAATPEAEVKPNRNDNANVRKGSNANKMEKVTVTGGRLSDLDERRLSTASKLVFGREELDRNGDSTVGEILKRLPGVTIGGRPGRGGEIRMRGLGNGYTQILINGERAPRGFSMDSLSPDQIERIEVIRGPVAEYSTQAIAGTINIVLREEVQLNQTQLRLSDGIEQGRNAPNLSVTYPGQIGSLSYLLSGSVFQNRQKDFVVTDNQGFDPQGQASLNQEVVDDSERRTHGIHFTPRFNYRFDNGDSLMFQPFVMQSQSRTQGISQLSQSVGPTPPYAAANWTGSSDSSMLRSFGNWQHRFDDNARLNLKFGMGASRSDSSTLRAQYDGNGTLLDRLVDTNAVRDQTASIGGKYTTPLGEGHVLGFGWDGEWGRRTQTRVSLDNGSAQFPDSGEDLNANTRRLAAFMQDEWEINAQWSTYLGLRWEGIHTASTTTAATLANESAVWSPVLHGVWRIPGSPKDQLRMSLTHSYRAPSLADLIALPALSRLNSPTSPDRIGNPALKPELATGMDFAFEHYLERSGIFSANAFIRSIDNLMRRQTTLQPAINGARWVSAPINIHHAITGGIELEAKFQLIEFVENAPAIEFRSNYSRFWSRVDDIPGPNNRLDQQPRQTANLGVDYRLASVPLTLGGNLNWTPAYVVQTSESQTARAGVKRQVDIYGLWKFTPNTQLRISANNLLHHDYLTGSSMATGSVNQLAAVSARTFTTLMARLEIKI